jgi:hypothetical protein
MLGLDVAAPEVIFWTLSTNRAASLEQAKMEMDIRRDKLTKLCALIPFGHWIVPVYEPNAMF